MRVRLERTVLQKGAVAFLAILGSVAVCAAGSRQFGGSYKVIKVTDQGSSVQVQLSLQIINHSGADVNGAKIAIKSSLPGGAAMNESWVAQQARFEGVTLHFNERKIVAPLEGTFTVPKVEYQRWLKGSSPQFVIAFPDASGKLHSELIDLAPQM